MISHLSYSSISTFLTCARSWYFQYIERRKSPTSGTLLFGRVFHDAIEDYVMVTRGWERMPPITTWPSLWTNKVAEEAGINWGDESESGLLEIGKRMLSTPEVIDMLNGIQPLVEGTKAVVEKRVSLTVPGVSIPIIGYIDIIEVDGIPCDLKTSAHEWSSDKANLEMQPLFYLAALNQEGYKYNPEQRFRHYIFTKDDPATAQVFEIPHTVSEMLWLFGQITETWRAIQTEIYPPNTTSWKCSPQYCQFWSICRGA